MAINLVKNSNSFKIYNPMITVDNGHQVYLSTYLSHSDKYRFDMQDQWSCDFKTIHQYLWYKPGTGFKYTTGFKNHIKQMETEYGLPFMTELDPCNPRASVCSIIWKIHQAKELFGKEVEAGY